MDSKKTLRPTIYTLLATVMLAVLPMAAMAAPQRNDVNKPTRERVKDNKKDNKENKDNKNTKTNKDNKDSKNNKETKDTKDKKKSLDNKSDSKANPVVEKKEEKKNEVKTEPAKTSDKNSTAKPAKEKQEVNKNGSDTANKPVASPKQKKIPMYPDKVQFDGIDISKYQANINWTELRKQSKIQFIYIRATVGSDIVDPLYKDYVRNARKNGFKVGSYHYFTNLSSAKAQFENFRKTADKSEQDLLPVIDVEEINRWSKQQLRDSVMMFAQLIEDYYGCKPLIYTNEKFFTSNLGRAFADYPLFIAKYNSTQPNIGYKWILWQFSDCGQFNGIVKGNKGEVDLSRFNKGCTINDILYQPTKAKPKTSVKNAVDHKEKPATVNMTEQKQGNKQTAKPSKRQQEEAKKKAEKENRLRERKQKIAEEEAAKKAEAEKKAREKEEHLKKEKARQQAREAAAKKEAEEKAKKKEQAKKAREEKAKRDAANKANKTTSLLQSSSSKLVQSQRNDSIRAAKMKGKKNNKSSADND